MEVDLSKKHIWGLNDVLSFGKYKGSTIKDVIKEEPSYLIWCQQNVGWFELDEDLLLKCEELVEQSKNRNRRRGRGGLNHHISMNVPDDFDLDDDIPF